MLVGFFLSVGEYPSLIHRCAVMFEQDVGDNFNLEDCVRSMEDPSLMEHMAAARERYRLSELESAEAAARRASAVAAESALRIATLAADSMWACLRRGGDWQATLELAIRAAGRLSAVFPEPGRIALGSLEGEGSLLERCLAFDRAIAAFENIMHTYNNGSKAS